MGRSRSRNNRRDSRTRDTFDIARQRRRFDPDSLTVWPSRLTDIEDRRFWYPEAYTRPVLTNTGLRHRLRAVTTRSVPMKSNYRFVQKNFSAPPAQIGFVRPESMTICERRKRRRETLFARRKTGRGGQKKPIWNEYSYVHCRRRK